MNKIIINLKVLLIILINKIVKNKYKQVYWIQVKKYKYLNLIQHYLY